MIKKGEFLFVRRNIRFYSRGTGSSLLCISFLASKWRLRNKSQLLFVIVLLANNFIFPGLYSHLPRGEKYEEWYWLLRLLQTRTKHTALETKFAKHLTENIACAMSSGPTLLSNTNYKKSIKMFLLFNLILTAETRGSRILLCKLFVPPQVKEWLICSTW